MKSAEIIKESKTAEGMARGAAKSTEAARLYQGAGLIAAGKSIV
jgi:hypothetical protein